MEQPDLEYDLILNASRTVKHWHTRTKKGAVPMLHGMVPNAWLEMHPADAERLSLRPHDRVTVVSRRNAVADVELWVTNIMAPRQLFMPFSLREHNSNLVTLGAFDPISREPNLKQCAVRVKRIQTAHRIVCARGQPMPASRCWWLLFSVWSRVAGPAP